MIGYARQGVVWQQRGSEQAERRSNRCLLEDVRTPEANVSETDLDAGSLNVDWTVLSKRQATKIISAMEPAHDRGSET